MERKSSAYPNSDDMFSTYAPKTYMENMPCELAFSVYHGYTFLLVCVASDLYHAKWTLVNPHVHDTDMPFIAVTSAVRGREPTSSCSSVAY